MTFDLVIDPEPRRIAIFRALYLGDLLCATPALRAIRARFPRAEITLIGLPWAGELVERLPWIDKFLSFPGFPGLPEVPYVPADTEAFLAEARRRRFDLVVQMHGSGEVSNEVVAAMEPAHSVGYGPPGDRLLEHALGWQESEHEVMRWLRLASALGCGTDDSSIQMTIYPKDREHASHLLSELAPGRGPVVKLNPGARDARRRWPPEQFARLGTELARRYGARLVLTGAEREREIADEVKARLGVHVLDLTGKTDLGSLAAVLAKIDLLVTNDTGTSHVAAATRTPSVVLFGPTDPARWAPLDRGRHVIVDATAVAGGQRATALSHLPVEPVLAACERQLSSAASPEGARLLAERFVRLTA